MWRAALLLLLALQASQTAIVDRIAATVGKRVITASTVRQQLRIAALLNSQPIEASPAAFMAMRERLIERTLILEEMRISRYPVPELGEIREAYDREVAEAGGETKFNALLNRYNLEPDHVRNSLRYQAAILRFTVFRFRPAVQINASDIRAYYDNRLDLPMKPPLEDVRDQIEAVLREEQIEILLNRWLSEVRQRTHIEIAVVEEDEETRP